MAAVPVLNQTHICEFLGSVLRINRAQAPQILPVYSAVCQGHVLNMGIYLKNYKTFFPWTSCLTHAAIDPERVLPSLASLSASNLFN